jgi:hypothetical protein
MIHKRTNLSKRVTDQPPATGIRRYANYAVAY